MAVTVTAMTFWRDTESDVSSLMGMSRVTLAITAALLAGAALVTIPASPAGSATSCVAWAGLPSRVSLAGREVVVRATLHGSPACRGVTADSGGSATLNGPGPSRSDFPLRWAHLGSSDSAPFYALDTLGTYRIRNGDLQTYDARYLHIPFEWRTTSTVVKYAGRFAGVSRHGATISARLQYYAKYGWVAHPGVVVRLQRRAADSTWHTLARKQSSAAGRVAFVAASGTYRLVSTTTASVWSATAGLNTHA